MIWYGFAEELTKLGGVGAMLGGKMLANAVTHAVINTKMSPKFLREFIASAGDDFMAAGFRHAIQGKKIHAIPQAMIGTAISPSAPYMYQTGYRYGRKVFDTMKQIPYVGADAPFKVLRGVDVGASKLLEHSPTGGAVLGAAYGAKSGREKGKKYPVREMLTSAFAGAMLGKGVKHYGPHAPGFRHVKWVRTKVVDPVLEGSGTKVSKILDAIATKTKG